MSRKVIDVSSYQGNIDWTKVKESGVQGAILKIIRKDLLPDRQFENNWQGCEKTGLSIGGVYNYSYAVTEEKAKTDARKVISVLSGRRTKVWLDLEDDCQKGLGDNLVKIVKTYQKEIETASLEFGVYTGLSFYNDNLKAYAAQLDCSFWIARYPLSRVMSVAAEPPLDKKPSIKLRLEGWQYSSKGQVPGIQGYVDLNLWYDELGEDITDFEGNPYTVPKRILRLQRIRMQGDDVKWIQYHLVRLGFLPVQNSNGKENIDGFFGSITDKAVREAQAYFGIVVDGIAGPMTVYVLQYN